MVPSVDEVIEVRHDWTKCWHICNDMWMGGKQLNVAIIRITSGVVADPAKDSKATMYAREDPP